MKYTNLLAVSAAYFLLLALCLGGYPQFALGASFAPIAAVFWGKRIYIRIRDNKEFIDWGASFLLLLHIAVPFVLAAPFMTVLRGMTTYTEMELVTPVSAMTILFEWMVYFVIWSLQAMAFQSQQMKMRHAQSVSAMKDQEAAERIARERVAQERVREESRRKQMQDEFIALNHEHEKEFYRLREETVGLFLKHHALLKEEISVPSIMKEFEDRQSSIHDSWNDFLRFNKRWQFRILAGAARNNLLNDYSQAQEAIADVLPRDQFMLLVNDAMSRDGSAYNAEACIERLTSLHDKIVQLFEDRSSEWQSNRDAVTAEAYDNAFAETDDEPKGQNPFDDDNRVTYQGNVS